MIGLAHGSRHPGVTAGIEALLAEVSARTGIASYPAYLDLTAPDLGAVAAVLAAAGERTAVVVPLLFTEAFHARIDVPAAVARAAEASGVHLVVAPVLGTDDDVLDVVVQRLAAAGTRPEEPVLLYAVGSSRAAANAAVAELASRLAARRGTPVRAGFGTTEPRAADVLADFGTTDPRAADVLADFGTTDPRAADVLAGFGTTEPRASDALADFEGAAGTVVPLFVAPGLLLDAIAPAVAAAGWRLADPLGTLLAPVIAHRYSAALADPAAPVASPRPS